MNPNDIPDHQSHQWFGARCQEDGTIQFRVFANKCKSMTLVVDDSDREITLESQPGGYFGAIVEGLQPGDRYWLLPNGGTPRPDPASRFQPDGVHGPSEIVSTSFEWTDQAWEGISRDQLVIYELHVGAFTAEGTYRSAIQRLDELAELGITAIELMPLAACPGQWNWGYDGVNLFAPSANYGTPDELRQLVNAAHAKGIAVILDVVYNHLGPEGNYLGEFGAYFSKRHRTPWGEAPNFDDPKIGSEVRRFAIANALMWLDEYHIDGLRVDAIHCIGDDSPTHIAASMTDAIRAWSTRHHRKAILIAESNVYDPEMTVSREQQGVGFDGQWCDDFVHGAFAVLNPGQNQCHREYDPADFSQTLQFGYVYEGTLKEQRGKRTLDSRVDTRGLIYCIQHHDFVGNHPTGMRLHQIVGREAQKAAAGLLLLSTGIPMLFMGEEFACENPFRFFVDFGDPRLRRAVVRGRKAEYPQHDWSNGRLPTDSETFAESKIGPAADGDQDMRNWYRHLLTLRKLWIKNHIINDMNLTVRCDSTTGIYQMTYVRSNEKYSVLSRLGNTGADTQPVQHDVNGKELLNSRPSVQPKMITMNHTVVIQES